MGEMTREEAISIGRAWPEWQWALGQALIDVDGDEGLVIRIVGRRLRVAYGCYDALTWEQAWECVPDLRDPGTRGHALAQVRAAWGDEYAHTCGNEHGWLVLGLDDSVLGEGPTEVEALLDARRAAP